MVLTGTIESSYLYSLKFNKLPLIIAMTIPGNLICPVTGTHFMELPELPISNSSKEHVFNHYWDLSTVYNNFYLTEITFL